MDRDLISDRKPSEMRGVMTEDVFNIVIKTTHITSAREAALKKFFVDGERAIKVAFEYNISRQNMNNSIRMFMRKLDERGVSYAQVVSGMDVGEDPTAERPYILT